MNNDQNLICCPTCTIKYTSYHNRCPKCGTPKPMTPNVATKEIESIPKQDVVVETPNVSKQEIVQPTIPINTGTYNEYNLLNNQYNLQGYQYNQNQIDYEDETIKTIKNLYNLSTIVLIIAIIFATLIAITLLSESYGGIIFTLISFIFGPGSILLIGIIYSQTLKWKALMLYQTQNKK